MCAGERGGRTTKGGGMQGEESESGDRRKTKTKNTQGRWRVTELDRKGDRETHRRALDFNVSFHPPTHRKTRICVCVCVWRLTQGVGKPRSVLTARSRTVSLKSALAQVLGGGTGGHLLQSTCC